MPILKKLGDIRRTLLRNVYRRDVVLDSKTPLITFTFDDFPRNALTVGGRILQENGARGTYFAAFGLMGKTTEVGPSFVEKDLPRVIEEGHELGSHTYSNIHARRSSAKYYLEEMIKGREALVPHAGPDAGRNFSYPFGELTFNLKRNLGTVLDSCRGIIGGINGPTVDLNLLLANKLYGDIEQLDAAEALIRQNKESNGWLIFYTHDVQPDPTPYGCTPGLLKQVVEVANKSGAKVLTVSEVLKLVKAASS